MHRPATRLFLPGIQGIKEQHTDEFPIGEIYFPIEYDIKKTAEYLDSPRRIGQIWRRFAGI